MAKMKKTTNGMNLLESFFFSKSISFIGIYFLQESIFFMKSKHLFKI